MSNKGKAGSLIDFRIAVEKRSLDDSIRSLRKEWMNSCVEWRSPLQKHEYAEYVDDSFWNGRLSPDEDSFWSGMNKPERFWPKGGPNWDGVATIENNGRKTLLLFEAKAHKGELISSCSAGEKSKSIIQGHINEAKGILGIGDDVDWLKRYYQFANRLAYITLLRSKGVDVACVYVYFANDPYWNLSDKTSVDDWRKALEIEFCYFNLDHSKLKDMPFYEIMIDLSLSEYKGLRDSIIQQLLDNMISL